MKKAVSILLALILTFAICLSANAWVEVVDCGSIEIEGLRPIKNGYHLMDVDEENSFVSDVVRGCPERAKSATFAYVISNDELVERLYVTVSGIYSQVGNDADITSASCVCPADGFDYRVSVNGNICTVYLTFDGVEAGAVSYKLATNGSITKI